MEIRYIIKNTPRGVSMTKEEVSNALEDVRPSLQADGGDIELVEVKEDGVVLVKLKGACHGCPMSQMTIKQGVETYLKKKVPGIKEVIAV
jgi:Fe-S cluster biogenesis protein NfuA